MVSIKSPHAVNAIRRKAPALTAAALISLLLSGCGAVRYVPTESDAQSNPAGMSIPESAEPSSIAASEVELPLPVNIPPNPYKQTKAVVPAAARILFADAIAAIRQQQWTEAEPLLQQLTVEYPQLSGPHLNLGLLYRQTDRNDEAEQAFRRTLETNANNLDAYNQLGILMREQGAFAEAEAYYLQALAIWPYHAPSHRNLGILYELYQGRLDKALEHFEKYQALQEKPDQQLAGWIVDLKRRLQESAGVAQPQQTAAAPLVEGKPNVQ